MKNNNGWVKSYRDAYHRDLGRNVVLWAIWNAILHIAVWKESKILWNGEQRLISPGTAVIGMSDFARKWDIPKTTVKRWLDYLVRTGRIEMETSTRGTIIKVVNWKLYQSGEQKDRNTHAIFSEHDAVNQWNKECRDIGTHTENHEQPETSDSKGFSDLAEFIVARLRNADSTPTERQRNEDGTRMEHQVTLIKKEERRREERRKEELNTYATHPGGEGPQQDSFPIFHLGEVRAQTEPVIGPEAQTMINEIKTIGRKPVVQVADQEKSQQRHSSEPGIGSNLFDVWTAYKKAYFSRYQIEPVYNGSVAGKLTNFMRRVPRSDAPKVAEWFVSKYDTAYLLDKKHPTGDLLQYAEKYYHEWKTQAVTTDHRAKAASVASYNQSVVQRVLAMGTNHV